MANKRIMITTPEGVAVYPHLLERDEYQFTEYGKEEFNTKLRLSPSTGLDELLATINSNVDTAWDELTTSLPVMAEELLAKAKTEDNKTKASKMIQDAGKLKKLTPGDIEKSYPYEEVLDEEGDATGEFIFKFKCKSAGEDSKKVRWEKELPLFDADRQKILGSTRSSLKLWGGSGISVMAEVVTFGAVGLKLAGVSLRLQAVQVIKPVGGDGMSADSTGFGVVEGGYVTGTNGMASYGTDANSSEPEDDDDF